VSSGDRGQVIRERLERGLVTLSENELTARERVYEGWVAVGISLEWSSVVILTDGVRRNVRRRQVSLDPQQYWSRVRNDPISSNAFECYQQTGNQQMYEVFDDTAVRVILALESGDSIRRVSQRLQTPYETVRQAVNRLEEAGFVRYDDGLYIVDDTVRDTAFDLLAASTRVSPPTIDEAYILPQFGDWPFAFTRIDAVYVWTHGGYQVGRTPDDYPLFLAVREQDLSDWQAFFDSCNIPSALERQPRTDVPNPIQIVLDPQPSLDIEHVEGHPVIPREETIEYMREHYVQFQSALSMLDRMYDDLDLDVTYRESERVHS